MQRLFILISVFLFMFTSTAGFTNGREFSYRLEQFSPSAHKMMGDSGSNAVYHISLSRAADFLPEQHPIKRRTMRHVNDHHLPGKCLLKLARHHILTPEGMIRHAKVFDFFWSFREDVPYTYAIVDDELVLTQSTGIPMKEKYKDRFSKHYLISGLAHHVRYAGEINVYKNSDEDEVFVVFDNASGTYCPPTKLLSDVRRLLDYNFADSTSRVYFVVKNYDQTVDERKLLNHDENPFVDLEAL